VKSKSLNVPLSKKCFFGTLKKGSKSKSLFFLNIIYIILELPLPIISFIALLQGDLYFYFLFLGYLGYAINSIIIVTTNSLFRKEFFS